MPATIAPFGGEARTPMLHENKKIRNAIWKETKLIEKGKETPEKTISHPPVPIPSPVFSYRIRNQTLHPERGAGEPEWYKKKKTTWNNNKKKQLGTMLAKF